MQEQRSEVKASCLFDIALVLMTTNYTPDHAHIQTKAHTYMSPIPKQFISKYLYIFYYV